MFVVTHGTGMSLIDDFRKETRDWLDKNCPQGARGPGQVPNGSTKIGISDPDVRLWLDRMVEKGWTVPNWPKEYGGAGLSNCLLYTSPSPRDGLLYRMPSAA